MRVRLDLNNPEFQAQWFGLEKKAQLAVLETCRKIAGMDWDQLYRDKGLRWEKIRSRVGPAGETLYSVRMTRKFRAVAKRSSAFLELLSLHRDHDSAYP